MKSPWQLGLLALALTSVSAYDIYFFKNRTQAPIQNESVSQPGSEGAAILPGQDAAAPDSPDPIPPISRENLDRLAMESFKPNEGPEEDSTSHWPSRDPFTTTKIAPPQVSSVIENPVVRIEVPKPAPPAEPQCVFTGALIQGGDKLALINGEPLSIGAQLGDWRLVDITPDHVILKAGNESRTIPLRGATASAESAPRKDSL